MTFDRARTSTPALLLLFVHIALGSACADRGTGAPIVEVVEPAATPGSDGVLRVATANMWGVSVLGFDWAREIDARFDAFAERLARNDPGLDVVLIQEAWKDSARRALLAHPGVARRFPHRVDIARRPGGAGLVVLSRIPLDAARFYRFRSQGNCMKFWEGDCLAGKGVVFVRARFGEHAVWIGNTHLIACYARDESLPRNCDEDDPNGRDRWQQLAELRDVVADLAEDDPVLLAGDFNFTRPSRYYASMRDPIADSTPRLDWTESGEATGTRPGVDFIWTRAGHSLRWQALEPVRAVFGEPVDLPNGESVPLSDHPILAGGFCLVRTGGPNPTCPSREAPEREAKR